MLTKAAAEANEIGGTNWIQHQQKMRKFDVKENIKHLVTRVHLKRNILVVAPYRSTERQVIIARLRGFIIDSTGLYFDSQPERIIRTRLRQSNKNSDDEQDLNKEKTESQRRYHSKNMVLQISIDNVLVGVVQVKGSFFVKDLT